MTKVFVELIIVGGLDAAKLMGLWTAISWLPANMDYIFRGLHAAKSWSGNIRKPSKWHLRPKFRENLNHKNLN